jgi:phosphoesterase RecJ-like protein
VCSELAMAEYLKQQRKKFFIVHEKPLALMHQMLTGHQQIKTLSKSFIDYDLVIILDCADKRRLGEVERVLLKGKPIINIDHHLTNDRFGHINIIDPKASSTAEVVFEMFKAWNVKLTKRIVEYLYLGILTDTGSFRYQNTTSRTHQITAELLRFRISPASFYRLAYEDLDDKGFKLLSKVMSQAQYLKHGKVISLSLSRRILDQIKERFDLKDKLFYVFRMIKDVEVIVLFSSVATKKTRVNFRSTKTIDVAAIAKVFGGGGHKAASGCILDKDIRQAEQIIFKEVLRRVV